MHERVIELEDPKIGMSGFLALHTLWRGPAHGGIRIESYPDLDACRADALRLSEAMTWKCLINDLPGGGGKVVLMREAIRDRAAVLRALGDRVEALEGQFFTGTDVGTTAADIEILRERTRYVACAEMSREAANGLLHAIRAACEFSGQPVRGLRVALQGLGAVGLKACRTLVDEGASVVGADPSAEACRQASEIGASIASTDEIVVQQSDLFSPCALGGTVNEETLGRLRCRMIVGAANNQLTDDSIADMLHARGILYVPDFLANSGATIRGAWENLRGSPGTDEDIAAIHLRTLELLEAAREEGSPPLRTALRRVNEKLRAHRPA